MYVKLTKTSRAYSTAFKLSYGIRIGDTLAILLYLWKRTISYPVVTETLVLRIYQKSKERFNRHSVITIQW